MKNAAQNEYWQLKAKGKKHLDEFGNSELINPCFFECANGYSFHEIPEFIEKLFKTHKTIKELDLKVQSKYKNWFTYPVKEDYPHNRTKWTWYVYSERTSDITSHAVNPGITRCYCEPGIVIIVDNNKQGCQCKSCLKYKR